MSYLFLECFFHFSFYYSTPLTLEKYFISVCVCVCVDMYMPGSFRVHDCEAASDFWCTWWERGGRVWSQNNSPLREVASVLLIWTNEQLLRKTRGNLYVLM